MATTNNAKRVLWRLAGRSRTASIALMYHRVADVERDPWGLAVSPAHFDEHLEVLRESYRPVTATRMADELRDGDLVPGSVAITFDDGYLDNLRAGLPLLERHDVPATFFVPTGSLGDPHEPWWDELDRLVGDPAGLSGPLEIEAVGRAWTIDDGDRDAAYHDIWSALVSVTPARREAAMEEIRAAAGGGRVVRASHRTVSTEELLELDASPLAEVGSHTVSHVKLSELEAGEQRREIVDSKAALEAALGHEVHAFSYPNGGRGPATPGLVREAGYRTAFTTDFGQVVPSTDRYLVPRTVPPDADGDGFARWLRWTLPPRTRRPATAGRPSAGATEGNGDRR